MKIVVALLCFPMAGCCGIGTGPSKRLVQRWIDTSKGANVRELDRVLREYRFKVEYDDHAMRAQKSTGCILVEDKMVVSLKLDELNRIIDGDVMEFRIAP